MQSEFLIQRPTLLIVLYYIPDHPKLLQEFLWQTLDLPPRFPRVKSFLKFWQTEIDAVIHSARLNVAGINRPLELKTARIVGSC